MRSLLPFRRNRRRSRGQSLVEFALLIPVILVMLAGALDLGRVFYATISLKNAAREGAFQAAETPTSYLEDQACDAATNLVVCRVQLEARGSAVSIAPTDIDLACSVSGCPDQAGSTVTVTVRGSFQLVTPLLAALFGGQTIPMTASATAHIEYLPDPRVATPPPAPVAAFGWSPNTPEVGQVVTFDGAASTGDPTDYQWDFGDGGQIVTTTATATHTYAAAGTYTVILTIVNLTGVDTEQRTITISSGSVPSPSASVAPSSAPTPSCTLVPNVMGQTPGDAQALLITAGFNVQSFADLTTGQKNKIQAQNPDHTQCLAPGTTITLHYRPN